MENKSVIAVYARESTKWQAENGYNLEDQKKRMELYVQATFDEGTYKTVVYEEAGASAKTLERPVMSRLIQDITEKRITHVLVYSIDRLSRTITDLIKFVELLQKHNVTLMSVTEKIDTDTPQGRFFLQLMGLLAQLERENISERTKRSLLESATQGNYAKATIPPGYKRDPESKKLIVDIQKADVIIKIFDAIASGKTITEVSKELRTHKVLNEKWSDARVNSIIRNPIYYGTYTVQGQVIEDHTEPLVTKELWERANNCIASMKPFQKHNYLYKGKIFCKKCGKLMTGTSTYNRQKRVYLYYQCVNCQTKIPQMLVIDQTANFFDREEKKNIYNDLQKYTKKVLSEKQLEYFEKIILEDIIYCENVSDKQKEMLAVGIPEEITKDIIDIYKKIQKTDFLKSNESKKETLIAKYLDCVYISEKKVISIKRKEEKKKKRQKK